MRTIDAVVFDWGGTLTPWHVVDARAQWERFAAGYGTMACSLNALAADLLAAEERAWHRARTEHTSSRLEDLLAEAGAHPSPATQAGVAAYHDWWLPHGVTRPDVEPTWRALRERGLKVGVLSNTIWPREHHRSLFERDGVLDLVDADLYSSEVPWTKPAPEIFREACRRLDVDPARAAYVGDRLFEDVWGPQQVGMKGVWVPHSTFPAHEVVEVEVTPDGVADELADVVALVDGWNA